VLLDCGLFQGLSKLRRRNWDPLPGAVTRAEAVVLTHAHLDHSGYLPVLARNGWHGRVYATEATIELAEIVLRDSAHLLEDEARHANEHGWSKHHPALPLYERADVDALRRLFEPLPVDEQVEVGGGVRVRLGRAGHILGSSWAHLSVPTEHGETTLLSSGDLGRGTHPLLRPPEPRPQVDTLLVESTYGDRHRHSSTATEDFAHVITRTAARGGSVLVPAFAVDRTEVLLFELHRMRREGMIPPLPVVLDSPMAQACLDVYRRELAAHSPDLRADLSPDALDLEHLVIARTREESIPWNDPRMPAIVISASGMATGGRVLHHMESMLPDPKHTLAIVGFAAEGTRARQLLDGATAVKIHGRYVPVRCDVFSLDAYSAHADADELFAWATAAPPPRTCYVVHGEQRSAEALAQRLRADADWLAVVPRDGERVRLSDGGRSGPES
jgi:metallo-beta-lactamase family protein